MRKNIKKEYILILFMGMLALFILSNIYMRNYVNKRQKHLDSFSESILLCNTILNNTLIHYPYEISSGGIILKDDIMLEDIHGTLTPFTALIGQQALIFRFSESDCLECMEDYFEYIYNLLDSEHINNIILVGNFPTMSGFQIFVNTFNVSLPVYNYPRKLGFPIDELDYPYFFVLAAIESPIISKLQ